MWDVRLHLRVLALVFYDIFRRSQITHPYRGEGPLPQDSLPNLVSARTLAVLAAQ